MKRRHFLQAAFTAGGIKVVKPAVSFGAQPETSTGFFKVHPAVENSPDAVFIMKTYVVDKYNAEAKMSAGLEFSRSVFMPSDKSGIPLTRKIAVKANILLGKAKDPYPEGYLMGANTDPWFVEGVIEGMKRLKLPGNRFYMRDSSGMAQTLEESGYGGMARRTGINLLESANVKKDPDTIRRVDIPDGIIHRRLPYLWPYNAPGTFLLNIAKFKSHAMGLTLCCKNLQGTIAHPYQGFCGGFKGVLGRCDTDTINPDYMKIVESNYRRHLKKGMPRWDKPGNGYNCGLGMETWAARTLDNMSVTPMGLCVIEGIYGRDGSHHAGPHPPYEKGNKVLGRTHDFMSNIIIFGKNPVHVDIIGHWLGGHEPGNFGLFHIALERKMSTLLDPRSIPVYRWENGKAVPASLDEFERTPLLTYYLRRNYDGQDEPVYHLCDEPYDYGG